MHAIWLPIEPAMNITLLNKKVAIRHSIGTGLGFLVLILLSATSRPNIVYDNYASIKSVHYLLGGGTTQVDVVVPSDEVQHRVSSFQQVRFQLVSALRKEQPAMLEINELRLLLSEPEQLPSAVQIERIAEFMAEQDQNIQAQALFQILYRMQLPFVTPYALMGLYQYNYGFDMGIPFRDVLTYAASVDAKTPEEIAFAAIVYVRLCEFSLRTSLLSARDYNAAEEYCIRALENSEQANQSLMSGYRAVAARLLAEALAKQEAYEEAESQYLQFIAHSEEGTEIASAWFDLATFVFEPQQQWRQAFEAYSQVLTFLPDGDLAQLAKAQIDTICQSNPQPHCR